jgi:hypothetical protein
MKRTYFSILNLQSTKRRTFMLALQVTHLKTLMSQLLLTDTFHIFLLESASVTTANTYTVDGRMQRRFFSSEEELSSMCPYEFAKWEEMQSFCLGLIKGKRTPLSFKFVFQLMPEHMLRLLTQNGCSVPVEQIKALVFTIHYDGTKALMTTGSSYHTFLMTKEPEEIWDKSMGKYLSQKGIAYEEA